MATIVCWRVKINCTCKPFHSKASCIFERALDGNELVYAGTSGVLLSKTKDIAAQNFKAFVTLNPGTRWCSHIAFHKEVSSFDEGEDKCCAMALVHAENDSPYFCRVAKTVDKTTLAAAFCQDIAGKSVAKSALEQLAAHRDSNSPSAVCSKRSYNAIAMTTSADARSAPFVSAAYVATELAKVGSDAVFLLKLAMVFVTNE